MPTFESLKASVAIGTDLVKIDRIDRFYQKFGDKALFRILTPMEIKNAPTHIVPYLAKRYAAKEAASKALGTGIAQGISFQHFEITNLPTGQPLLLLTGAALQRANALGYSQFHLSLSDEHDCALAFVVLE